MDTDTYLISESSPLLKSQPVLHECKSTEPLPHLLTARMHIFKI
jgi:hypothetical protein